MATRQLPLLAHDARHLEVFAEISACRYFFAAAPGIKRQMVVTIDIEDRLLKNARSLTGTEEINALVRQALETLVRLEAGKRLVALGGTMPDAAAGPLRQSEDPK